MMKDWKIVERDGNPSDVGEYMTVLIFHERVNGNLTGRILATVDSRMYWNRDKTDECWVMRGQNDNDKVVWLLQGGSFEDEYVYAWREIPSDVPELPDGIEWDDWIKEEIE